MKYWLLSLLSPYHLPWQSFPSIPPEKIIATLKRLSDIAQLKLALENYRLFEGAYPASISPGSPLIGSTTGNIYLNPVPVNDAYQDISCSQSNYYYTLASSTDYYTILFCLEKKVDKYSAEKMFCLG